MERHAIRNDHSRCMTRLRINTINIDFVWQWPRLKTRLRTFDFYDRRKGDIIYVESSYTDMRNNPR